jgi:sugar lactone lactonase YvrE
VWFAVVAAVLPSTGVAVASSGSQVPLWVSRYSPGGVGQAMAIGPSADGLRVFVTGQAAHGQTVAFDAATGEVVWVGTNLDGLDLAVAPAGDRVFVAGADVAAFDQVTGVEVWRANWPLSGTARAIVLSADGETVYVTGHQVGTQSDYETVALDASTGARLWEAPLDGPGHGNDVAYAIAVSPDGARLFVTGTVADENQIDRIGTAAYDAATGVRLWAARFGSPGPVGSISSAIAASPDGATVYVTGSTPGRSGWDDYVTVAYGAATGTMRWVSRYDGPAHFIDTAGDMVLSGDGDVVYVTGTSSRGIDNDDVATIALRAQDGRRRWVSRYDPTGVSEFAGSIALGPDGTRVYVAGTSVNDFLTLGLDAVTGQLIWDATYDGEAHDIDTAAAVAVDPGGLRVYVTGRSDGLDGFDYATIAYPP